jgi:hypothetical protein
MSSSSSSSSLHWNSFTNPTESQQPKKKQKIEETPNYTFKSLETPLEIVPDICKPTTSENNQQSTSLMVAETNFFNQRNTDYWHRQDLSHLRPYDFPYVRALLQQAACDTLSPEDIKHKEHVRVSIQVVTRAYEEKYLCEPTGKQRACILGDQCQGLHLPYVTSNAFVVREFLLPTEEEEYLRTGKLPTVERLCLLCKRSEIARAFINIRADGMGVKNNVILQDYRNIVGETGEYCLEDCIVGSHRIFQGLLDPIVLHLRNAYRLKIKDGVRHYEQWRMKYPGQQDHFLVDAPSAV